MAPMIGNAIRLNLPLAVRYRREKRSMNHFLDSRLFRYFVFGAMAAMLQVAALAALVEVAQLDKAIASTTAFYIAVVVNYFLQSRYTFRSFEPHWVAMPKFVGVSTIGAVINVIIFTILASVMHYLVAQCISLLIVFFINYSASKILIFQRTDR
ncbi:MAG: GtrA family protein [Mesorhizobium sp.]|nr:MAG: GtrA family protein [Mesorhizobium sp.]